MDISEHFHVKEAPFRIGPDPRFLYLSDQVQEAIAKCEYMARERIAPIYMYGPIGAGKTTILRRVNELMSRDEKYNVALLITPNVKTSNAFLRVIMESFEVKTERSYDQSLKNFEAFLMEQRANGLIPVLLVDEAQNVNRDILKLIHYLLNFETSTEKLLQVVLNGQEELATKILRYPELASRMMPIAMNPMSFEELKAMLTFRWNVAGGQAPLPFDEDAYKILFAYSKGLPRDAIKTCDEALRYLVAEGKTLLTGSEMEQIAKDVNLTL